MQEIIFRQRSAARPLTARTLLVSAAGIFLRLAIAQLLIAALVSLTGAGMLHAAFYLYAVWLLADFVRATTAGCVYTLGEKTLVLERRLGDSTTGRVEIPLDQAVSLRPVRMAENLHISYRRVEYMDAASKPLLRVRAAFIVSLLSSHLARALAGKRAQDAIGYVIVFDRGGMRRACTFCPNEQLLEKLGEILGERYGFDERMTRAKVRTLYARALERTFPALYPFVDPLVKAEDVQWAREELARQKAERLEKKNPKQASGPKEEAKEETLETAGEEAADTGAQHEAPRRRRKQG